MKSRVSFPHTIYASIKAMPREVRGELSAYALGFLFEEPAEEVSEAAKVYLPVLVSLLERAQDVAKVRARCANIRWQAMQSNAKQCKAMQKGEIEQKEDEKEPKKEQIEQKEGVFYTKDLFWGDERKKEKEKKKEKENAPLITPLKEKEIIKEKEKKKDILVHQSFFEEENTPTKPKKATTSQRMPRPTLEEVQAYILKMGYTFSGEEFFAFYESNGWKVGRNPMKSWQAACRTWQGGRPKTTPVTSGQALPLGLPADEWASVEKWAKENTTLNLKPDEYLNIRAFCHRKAAVVRAILAAVNKMPNVTDIVQEARILSNRDPYRLKIWED